MRTRGWRPRLRQALATRPFAARFGPLTTALSMRGGPFYCSPELCGVNTNETHHGSKLVIDGSFVSGFFGFDGKSHFLTFCCFRSGDSGLSSGRGEFIARDLVVDVLL